MRAIHITALCLLGLTGLSLGVATLPLGTIPLLLALTISKVMLVLLVFAELRQASRSWQTAFCLYFLLLLGCLFALLFLAHRAAG
ncbi:cytochrome C oxidase subunit IV family protein [Niveispirillum sp. BGYR6]|uniref:cytochrome C oxidase subunit IV family protein n=1 Tax=Niveispirillum sp. BGYR6 TaxID=2971249 RepID=UPI0022B9C120|nr:cytochrome C oxidase subunit IV family protein [Niveispirillum sp. BGYR6]MDG5493910.1 cytochrome C oxidase subunit IV family protein [Niveispirillum sp. BGYR6]